MDLLGTYTKDNRDLAANCVLRTLSFALLIFSVYMQGNTVIFISQFLVSSDGCNNLVI